MLPIFLYFFIFFDDGSLQAYSLLIFNFWDFLEDVSVEELLKIRLLVFATRGEDFLACCNVALQGL